MAAKAKAPAKKAVKSARKVPALKKAVKHGKAVAKPAKKSPATRATAVRPAAKPATRAGRKPVGRPPGRPAGRPVAKPASRSMPTAPERGTPAIILPRPTPPKPVARPASAKDIAAAHEYLLTRSAGRSEAPIVVNGKRLPTEEELLKMAEAEYMNDSQLAFFRHRLQQLESELLSNADETTEHLRETVIVPDPADRATIEEEHALELRTRDRERKLLKKVQAALRRIDTGEYGFCEETGDPIGVPRLLARPTATLSLEAQQRREMKQRMYGD